MVREGYPLPDLTSAENERIWTSLIQRRRRPQLAALLELPDTEIDARITALRETRPARQVARERG